MIGRALGSDRVVAVVDACIPSHWGGSSCGAFLPRVSFVVVVLVLDVVWVALLLFLLLLSFEPSSFSEEVLV